LSDQLGNIAGIIFLRKKEGHGLLSTAVETIVANLCWVPPLVGWLMRK